MPTKTAALAESIARVLREHHAPVNQIFVGEDEEAPEIQVAFHRGVNAGLEDVAFVLARDVFPAHREVFVPTARATL